MPEHLLSLHQNKNHNLLEEELQLLEKNTLITEQELTHLKNTSPNSEKIAQKEIELLHSKIAQAKAEARISHITSPNDFQKLYDKTQEIEKLEGEAFQLQHNQHMTTLWNLPTYVYNNIPSLEQVGSAAYNTGEFIIQRIPNLEETITQSIFRAPAEAFILTETFKKALNPTAVSFVRDLLKISSTITSYYYDQQIGGTKYHYDEFLVLGSLIKPTCKIALISALPAISAGTINPVTASRASNYICEVPSRTLTKISRTYQNQFSKNERDEHTLLNKLGFLIDHFTFETTVESTVAAIMKTTTSDLLGEFIGGIVNIGTDGNKKHIISIALEQIFGNEQNSKLYEILEIFTKNIFTTYMLAPPARIVEDLPGLIRKTEGWKIASEMFTFYANSAYKYAEELIWDLESPKTAEELHKFWNQDSTTHPSSEEELVEHFILTLEQQNKDLSSREAYLQEVGALNAEIEEHHDSVETSGIDFVHEEL